jgi:hypothetical protein
MLDRLALVGEHELGMLASPAGDDGPGNPIEHHQPVLPVLDARTWDEKTEMPSSGTGTSHSHSKLQISASRHPVFTANEAISAR